MSGKTYTLALLATLAALAIAGCGSGGDSSGEGGGGLYGGGGNAGSTESSESTGGAYGGDTTLPVEPGGGTGGEAANVSLASVGGLGLVLVDAKGFTLYDFHKDKGGKSACYGQCAAVWPPLLTDGEPTPGNGAQASLLGTVERTDGTTQVTYAGHPLYTYAADKKPGEANGNDFSSFGAQWYALLGNGKEPEDS